MKQMPNEALSLTDRNVGFPRVKVRRLPDEEGNVGSKTIWKYSYFERSSETLLVRPPFPKIPVFHLYFASLQLFDSGANGDVRAERA